MLDSKVYVQLGKDLKELDPSFAFTVTGDGDVTVNVATLKGLIALAGKPVEDQALKADRLNELHAWMVWRHERAIQVRDTEKERSHVGTLFFIETGLNPLQHGEETAEFGERLREEALARRAQPKD